MVLKGYSKMNIIQFGNKNNALGNLCVGEKQKTLVIAGVGTSESTCSLEYELKKVRQALLAGADTESDNSYC